MRPGFQRRQCGLHRIATLDSRRNIVGPAIFLASDLSAYVTGSIMMADGG
jgi:enoyl-[acyl-carrier-protein] reductase (NADH)